jgi:exopolyphosphatase/pppGpp-phosphohydrolase
MNDPSIEQAHLAYASLRRSQPDGTPITVICIGPEKTHLVCGKSDRTAASVSLDIGAQKTSAEHFKHCPPTPREMENAIMSVEDEIARVPASLVAGSSLFTTDDVVREIARVAGLAVQPVMHLGIAEVEKTFDRLVYVVQGRPASSEGLPEAPEFSATLLILSEFMHHLGFPLITIDS